MHLILIISFSVQAALHENMQPCPHMVIYFSHNIDIVHQFSLGAGVAEAACDAYMHIAMESLYTNIEKLLLECNTTR